MQTILEKLKREDPYKWFSEPIDPVALNIPTYNQVITQPMDLKTLGLRVLQGQVTKPSDFAVECRRIFTNCATFNKPTDDNAFLLDMCKKLHKLFDAEYKTFSSSDATRKREAKAHAEQAEEVSSRCISSAQPAREHRFPLAPPLYARVSPPRPSNPLPLAAQPASAGAQGEPEASCRAPPQLLWQREARAFRRGGRRPGEQARQQRAGGQDDASDGGQDDADAADD